MTETITTLDVREEFRSGQHPCDKIQDALAHVGEGQTLRLLVPFEPVPLFEVARNKGLTHDARQISGGDWEVLFSQGGARRSQPQQPEIATNAAIAGHAPAQPDGLRLGQPRSSGVAPATEPTGHSCGCGCHESSPTEIVDVDARGLEPPQPMVKILETLQALPGNAELHARTDRRPVHLYPMLEARGFTGESEEQPDGSFITYIRRA